jgi:flagellar biosynthesis/type III secretory pathway chaperone
MSEQSRWVRLKSLMEQECDLLDTFVRTSDEMRASLHERKWPNLEETMIRLDSLADRLSQLERKRHSCASRMAENGDTAALVAALPPEDRKDLIALRTRLRTRVTSVRSRMHGLGSYAESRMRLGRELLEELVPDTRGRLYDRRGRASVPGRDALLVSRHL